MISIGNDIVCLPAVNAERTQQKKFYSKILSQQEIELYNSTCFNSISLTEFVWLGWSVKESVYKFEKRFNPKLLFARTKIIIERIEFPSIQNAFTNTAIEDISFNENECFCCMIKFNGQTFFTRSFIHNKVIFTVANNKDCFENIYWGLKQIEGNSYSIQTKKVREFILNKLHKIFETASFQMQKTKEDIPFLDDKKNIPISLSHHENFVGYAFVLI